MEQKYEELINSSYPLHPHRTAAGGRDFKRRRNAEEARRCWRAEGGEGSAGGKEGIAVGKEGEEEGR